MAQILSYQYIEAIDIIAYIIKIVNILWHKFDKKILPENK